MAKFGFIDNDGADVGEKYVTKEYAMDVYPNIFTNINMAGLYSWGDNGLGALGTNDTNNRSSPGTLSGGGLNWRAVTSTSRTRAGAGLKNDGTLWTWGSATYGVLGNGSSTASRSSPVTVSGGGVDWGAISGSTGAGGAVFFGLKNTGLLYSWGRGTYGGLGSNGTANRSSPVTIVGGITDWVSVSGGGGFAGAIRSTGQLYTWGFNSSGQLGAGSTTNRSSPATTAGGGTTWVFISAGTNNFSAIKSDGTLWTWGANSTGQLGDGSTTNRSSPATTAGGGTNWKSVSSADAVAAIKTDGTLWTWGNNSSGQLGNGSTTNRSSPATVAGGGTNWVKVNLISIGNSCYGLKADGTLWTWGDNTNGTLGDGSTTSRSSPGTVAGGETGWKALGSCNIAFAIREEDGW